MRGRVGMHGLGMGGVAGGVHGRMCGRAGVCVCAYITGGA